MIKAVIFDCFGVILTDSLQQMYDELSESNPERMQQAEDLLNATARGYLSREDFDRQISGVLGISHEDFIKRKYSGETRNDQLLSYILELKKKYKTAMLSNVSNQGLMRRFDGSELDKYFDVVVASGEIGFAKPEPQAYEITADKLGVRLNECVFIDDRQEYCDGARGVGMQAIQYTTFAQLKKDLAKILSANAAE